MIKTRIICCILFFTISFAAFSLELTTGLTYDTHEGSLPVGTDFSLKETFSDSSNLTAGLRYNNAGAYTATFTYCRFLNIFMLSGGLNYDINTTGISQNIAFGTGLLFKRLSLLASGALRINPDNIFSPDVYSCSADVLFDTTESIAGLSFLYSIRTSAAGKATKTGGGFSYLAYQTGAPADIEISTNTAYISNRIDDIYGLMVDAGIKINIYLPFMNIQLKGTADIINPEYTGSQTPYTISLSTGFKL